MAVGGVPRLQIRERADAVDARISPEVDQHDAPAQPRERQRPVARRVEPVLRFGEFGGGAEVFESARVRQQLRLAGAARLRGCADARLVFGLVAGDLRQAALDGVRFLQRCGQVDFGDVLGDVLVEVDVQFGGDRDRGDHHDRAEHAPQRRAATRTAHAVEQLVAAERQRQQHDARAERVGDRHRDRAPGRRADGDDGRQDRTGAGCVYEPERGSDEQARGEPVPAESGPPPRPLRSAPVRDRRASMRSARPGTISARPITSSTATAKSRSGSEPSPTPPTTLAMPTIVIVNVTISPTTTPSGRRRPPTAVADSSAGSTGSTHGDSAVPAPARTAKYDQDQHGLQRKLVRASLTLADDGHGPP